VCPYSYLLALVGEEAEDEGLVEVEWLPFKLRPAPAALPEPRGEYSVTTGAPPSTGSLRTTGSRSTLCWPTYEAPLARTVELL
jgi:hypothetical protein